MNKKKCKIILPIVLAAVVLAGAGIWQATRPKEVTNYDVEFEAVQEAPGQETSESSSGSAIQIPGYKSISIPAGTRDVSVELMNPEENDVYFEISFYLPETDETIYTSKMIRPLTTAETTMQISRVTAATRVIPVTLVTLATPRTRTITPARQSLSRSLIWAARRISGATRWKRPLVRDLNPGITTMTRCWKSIILLLK